VPLGPCFQILGFIHVRPYILPNIISALGWCTRANASSPMIVCGIGNHRHTKKGIEETETFSVNIPSSNLLERTNYCGLVSGSKVDKSETFDIFYGSLKIAPMIW
jgi:flavin reductase (DIM6/NTAB) family NADH-FMN oxidoreductase RutF